MPKVYLLSRFLDPTLALFTGILAFYLHETNPRSAPPPGHTLRELAGWQWGQMRAQRRARDQLADSIDTDWERISKELDAGTYGDRLLEEQLWPLLPLAFLEVEVGARCTPTALACHSALSGPSCTAARLFKDVKRVTKRGHKVAECDRRRRIS